MGKFPIPRNGVRIPRELVKELAVLAGRERQWSKDEEKAVTEIIVTLRSHTLYPTTQ